MPSLVEELQRDALSSKVDVADLLRKAYAVAVKLKLDQFQAWCKQELDGYRGKEVPTYRRIRGSVRAMNPYRGWIPFFSDDAQFAEKLTWHESREPVGQIQQLVKGSDGKGLIVRFSQQVQLTIMQASGVDFEIALHLDGASVSAILDAVRNTILDWSLKLEADGIVGDGMSFSAEEKQVAERKAEELQSVVNNISIGTMVNSSLQQGSTESKQRHRA